MFDVIRDILWILAGVGTFWALTPTMLELLGLGWESSRVEEDPALVGPGEDDPDYARTYRELLALGFRPAAREKRLIRFLIGAWQMAVEGRWLAAPDGRCFAALVRLIPGAPLRVHFATCTAEGGQVVGVTPPEGADISEGKWHRVDLKEASLAEALAAHRAEVDAFTRQRGTAVSAESLPTAVDLNRALDEHIVRSKRWVFAAMTGIFFVIPALLIFGLCAGIDPPDGTLADYAAMGLFVGTLGYMFYRFALIPLAVRHGHKLAEATRRRRDGTRGAL
jgi:hypothetical protein